MYFYKKSDLYLAIELFNNYNQMISFSNINFLWIAIAIITFCSLLIFNIKAPYGRHSSTNWGKMISNKWGWFIMELPAFILMPLLSLIGHSEKDLTTILLLILWTIHYGNRTLIFPFRIKTKNKKMPLLIVVCAFFFNGVNGVLNGYFIGYLKDSNDTILSANVLIGLSVFIIGMYLNKTSDKKLISLREKNEGYQIPTGGLFNYISCPNHFGEIIEWIGFSIIAWNLPATTFAIWTFCNLAPRSNNHHNWYKENFKDYPKNRKALIPFIW